MWDVGERTITDLVQMIASSRLALPQFQRPTVWGKANWVPFLHTVLLGRPTGTLLLLEATETQLLNPRNLDTAPDIDPATIDWLLLDGQQRMTTLYQAIKTNFGSSSKRQVVIDLKTAICKGALLEDHLDLESANNIGGHAELAQRGLVNFETLFDRQRRGGWRHTFINTHFDGDAESFESQLNHIAPGLDDIASYRFPVLEIKRDTPLDVVADIFEGMNRRGQPLNKFDLMVARLYQKVSDTEYYDLRDVWHSSLANAPNLTRLGVGTDDGMLPLQLIAKQVSRLHPDLRGRVKGLTSGDVLELPAGQVIGDPDAPLPRLDLTVAIAALDAAAAFLIKHCGVVAPRLLPQQAMLLPLADQFLRPEANRLSNAQLKRWFFSVSLRIDYYGSVNSYADRDCDNLTRWADDGTEPPYIQAVDKAIIDQLDLAMAFSREGNILGRAVMALLVQSGALDWAPGQLNVKDYDQIDFHHVVPEQKLKDWYKRNEDRRPIAALTPLWATTNRSIGTKSASDVIVNLGNEGQQTLASHQLNVELASKAHKSKEEFEAFLVDREARLKGFIIAAIGM